MAFSPNFLRPLVGGKDARLEWSEYEFLSSLNTFPRIIKALGRYRSSKDLHTFKHDGCMRSPIRSSLLISLGEESM